MPGRSRPSTRKRERESSKRQRRLRKAEKAAEKRELRKQATEPETQAPAIDDSGGGVFPGPATAEQP
jgi:hypothetical protein